MDDRWLVHNLHWESTAELRARDPQLRRLQRQPLVHRPALLGRLPRAALALELEASVLGHLRRAFPTYYVKGRGEIDAAYVAGDRLWPIEVKWTRSLRPADFDTIARYPGGLVAGRVRSRRLVAGVPVLPAPVVLLRIARMAGSGADAAPAPRA